MGTIGLFYGSDWGNTEKVAKLIQKEIGEDVVDLYNLATDDISQLNKYEKLIFGVPTADEHGLQKDWMAAFSFLDGVDFQSKIIALFGLGDQKEWSANFVDALGILHDKVKDRGGLIIGAWPADGYEFKASKAFQMGMFVGLVIDEDNQMDLTEKRIGVWLNHLSSEVDFY